MENQETAIYLLGQGIIMNSILHMGIGTMGTRHSFQCAGCGYEAVVSGGPDQGMTCSTITVRCTGCKDLRDVVVGYRIEGFREVDSLICKECRGRLIEWNMTNGKCPRCGKNMEETFNVKIDWD